MTNSTRFRYIALLVVINIFFLIAYGCKQRIDNDIKLDDIKDYVESHRGNIDSVTEPSILVQAILEELEHREMVETSAGFGVFEEVEGQYRGPNPPSEPFQVQNAYELGRNQDNFLFQSSTIDLVKKLMELTDNRHEFYMVSDLKTKSFFRGVAVAIPRNSIHSNILTSERLKNKLWPIKGKLEKSCGFQFADQKVIADFTAFAVGKRYLLTTIHEMSKRQLKSDYYYLFDAFLNNENDEVEINRDNLYRCLSVIKSDYNKGEGVDYALLRLNKRIPEDRILEVDLEFNPEKGEDVYTIGSSEGLALKYVPDGYYLGNYTPNQMNLKLNVFKGNSGGPLFSGDKVVGMITSGRNNGQQFGSCVIHGCMPNGCSGEFAMYLSSIPDLKKYLKD